jgi:hypothetical protein
MTRQRKRGKVNQDHIKDKRFEDRNISTLEGHQRAGKTLKSPFSRIPVPITWRSWYDECLPNILWACILSSFLDRDCYLDLFRRLISDTREKIERRKETFVTHNYLATMTENEFDTMFSAVLANEEAKQHLSALRLIGCLPDRAHWARHLPDPDPEKDWLILARAVHDTFDHHSQRATDIRWLKVMHHVFAREDLSLGPQQAEIIEEFRLYPNKGDMNTVRPRIRSIELATRGLGLGEELTHEAGAMNSLPLAYVDAFWSEMKTETRCIGSREFKNPEIAPAELRDEVREVYQKLGKHFHATTITTAPDSRHDGAFGLTLYALTLLIDAVVTYSHNLVEGRIILRSIMEAFVTLH